MVAVHFVTHELGGDLQTDIVTPWAPVGAKKVILISVKIVSKMFSFENIFNNFSTKT